MTIVHSLPTMLSLFAAVALTLWGARGKGGRVLSFFGGLLCCVAVVLALTAGAPLEEALLCALTAAMASLVRHEGRGGT